LESLCRRLDWSAATAEADGVVDENIRIQKKSAAFDYAGSFLGDRWFKVGIALKETATMSIVFFS
jgi:hypothetical protein